MNEGRVYLDPEIFKLHADNLREISVVKQDLQTLKEDMKELKHDHKTIMEFMYRMQGGKAWFFGLLTIAAAAGSALSAFIALTFHR